jgi:competence protein ComEA
MLSLFVRNVLRGRLWAASILVTFLMGACAEAPVPAQTATTPAPTQTIAQKIAASKDLLDINTATPAQLKALPGIGDAYVQRIVAGRPYTAKNQLATRGIIPAPAYESIKDQIIAHRPKP